MAASTTTDIPANLLYDHQRLTKEHGSLNQRITDLLNEPEPGYQFLIAALKRIKLGLKDQLAQLELPFATAAETARWQTRNTILLKELSDIPWKHRTTRLAVAA